LSAIGGACTLLSMTRIPWLGALVGGVVGGGLAALVQWWPTRPNCTELDAPGCPPAVAGSVTPYVVVLGAAIGIGIVAVLWWLGRRSVRKGDLGGRETDV
jgi:hypothetical protein